ncbi:hypothetical protein [Gracilibacillus phocaeensis]|uniref:hypothetical protein n=1 Tax=Gracilibacillus phocaeensis TaxID=2042304 RepID=UPI0010326E1F|nr:hypothetical protein [Gracilibacillus phocaeensis]
MKRVFLLVVPFLLGVSLAGCEAGDQQNHTDVDNLEEQEGVVVSIRDPEEPNDDDAYAEWYYMLVIPDIEGVDIAEKTKDELEDLARENDGAYYNVPPDLYKENDFDTGAKVKMYWNGNQGESSPPVREAEKMKFMQK